MHPATSKRALSVHGRRRGADGPRRRVANVLEPQSVVAAGLNDVRFGDAHEGHLVTETGAKPNVRSCAIQRSGVTKSGRKRNGCFGAGSPEKRTASYRPDPVVGSAVGAPRKRTSVGHLASSVWGGDRKLAQRSRTDLRFCAHPVRSCRSLRHRLDIPVERAHGVGIISRFPNP
jgi:hypothetical protein